MRSSDNLHEGIQDKESWKGGWNKDGRVTGSASFSGGERNHFFLNLEGKQFDDISGVVGLDSPADSRAWASIDIDRDGLIDIAMVNANNPAFTLYRNRSAEVFDAEVAGHMVAIDLRGGLRSAEPSREWSNRNAVGSQVTLTLPDGTELLRERHMGEGFASQNSGTLMIGVGQAQTISKVEVRWPSGKTSTVERVAVGQRIEMFENPADSPDGRGVVLHPYVEHERTLVADAGDVAEVSGDVGGRKFTVAAANARAHGAQLRLYTTMATWCESCKKHLPHFELLREALGEDELALFGLPSDAEDTPEMLRSYLQEFKPGYDLLIELQDSEREAVVALLAETVRKEVLPSTIVTDAEGHVLLAKAGLPSISELRALLMR